MNDIRKYITLVESQELDEAGGIIDRLLSKLPGKIGARAEGRVDNKEISKLLRKSWVKFAAGAADIDERSSDDIKDFLRDASLTDEQLDQIPALRKNRINVNDVMAAAAEYITKNAGADYSGGKEKIGKQNKATGSPKSVGQDDVMAYFKKMDGNSNELTTDFRRAGNAKKLIRNDDYLGAVGYSHLKQTAGA